MPTKHFPNRRDALKIAALSALSLPWVGVASSPAAAPASSVKKPGRTPALKLGVASFSLAKLPVDEVIGVLKELELDGISLYKNHADWSTGTPAGCKAVVQKFGDAGIAV